MADRLVNERNLSEKKSGRCIKNASLPFAFAHQSSGCLNLPPSGQLQNMLQGRSRAAAITSISAKSISSWKTIMLEIWMMLQRTSVGKKNKQKKKHFYTGSRTGDVLDLHLLLPSITVLNNGCCLEAFPKSRCKPTLLQTKMSQMHHRCPVGPSNGSDSVVPLVSSVPKGKKCLLRWVKDSVIKCLLQHPTNPSPQATRVKALYSSVQLV